MTGEMLKLEKETPKSNDFIGQVIGDWGRWQFRTVILIYLCKIPSAWFMACIIFTAPVPGPGEFFCYQPEDSEISEENDWNQTRHPYVVASNNDFCSAYNRTHNEAMLNNSNPAENVFLPCTSFQFNSEFETTVTRFSLVCSRSILIAVSQFFHLFGVLTGGILATKLLETISPRTLMLYGLLSEIITGCLAGLVPNYEVHMIFRCLAAVCCAQMYTAGQVIFTDVTAGTYRTVSICLFESFWSIGVILLPLIAYIDPNWTHIYLMISLSTILYIPLWFLIPDSPRWLLRRAKVDDTIMILQNAVSVNQTEHLLPNDLRQRLCAQMATTLKEPPPAEWRSLWRGSRTVGYMIAVHIAWAVYVTNYNGMLLNVKAFGREYLTPNTIAFGISEIIGVFIGMLLILKTKRKWKYAGVFNICAGLFASLGFVYPKSLHPETKVALLMLTAVIPKIAVSCSQSMLFTCTTELVPPEKRKILVFSCVVWARIWLLTAPFIGVLITFHQVLALSAFGLLSVMGGMATFVLSSPRTIEKRCPESVLPSDYVPGTIFIIDKYSH